MNLLVLDDVLSLSLVDIEEQILVLESEIAKGFVVDHLENKSPIDKPKFEAVLDVLKQAKVIKVEAVLDVIKQGKIINKLH